MSIKIKDLRKSQKITQEEMARLLEIGRSAYAKIENGINEVSPRHIVKISEIFNVSTDWLLKGEDINTQSKQEGPDFNALGKYKEVVFLMVKVNGVMFHWLEEMKIKFQHEIKQYNELENVIDQKENQTDEKNNSLKTVEFELVKERKRCNVIPEK